MSNRFLILRERAKKILNNRSLDIQSTKKTELAELLEELDTYRIELELQNEDLKQANENLRRTEEALRNEIAIHYRHYDIAPAGYLTLNPKKFIIDINLTLANLLGVERSQLLQKNFTNFIIESDQDVFYFFLQRLSDTHQLQSCELRIKTQYAEPCWVKLDSRIDQFQHDLNLHIAVSNISQLKEMENTLRLAGSVFKECSEAIMVTDAKLKIIKVNKAFTEITGYSEDEVLGKKPTILQSNKQNSLFYHKMWTEINQYLHWRGEIWNKRKNGEIYPEWLSITATKNAENKVTHYISVFSDLSGHKKSEAHVQFMAYYDALTELPNRSLLQDHVELAIAQAQRNQTHIALLILDIDHFKVI